MTEGSTGAEDEADGCCTLCRDPFGPSDKVRFIRGEPYHRAPCWNTRRKQIARAKKARDRLYPPGPVVPIR